MLKKQIPIIYLILAFSFGMAVGPPFSGYIFDVFHSYRWAFNVLISTYILTLLSIYSIRLPEQKVWGGIHYGHR